MRIMLVADKPDLEDYLRSLSELPGSFLVHYQHPLKALDNLSEIRPDLVVWDHNDFPRHWKICAAWCRDEPGLEDTTLAVVSEGPLGEEETSKAKAFPGLRFIESDYYSDEFSRFMQEFVKQTSQPVQPVAKTSGKYRKIALCGPAGTPILFGTVLSASGTGLTAQFPPSQHAFLADRKGLRVFTTARGSGNNESDWLKLQILEIQDDFRISFACL